MGGLSGLFGLRGLSGLTAKFVVAGGFDPDAQVFFTAANITDPTQRNAVNALVIGKKANGTWSKHQAIYPFVGGTALQHSFNLKNPATFQITWGGTVTHNTNGITGNGSTGYGDTTYIPSTSATLGSNHISVYCRTDKISSNTLEMGVVIGTDSSRAEWGMQLKSGNTLTPILLGGNWNDYPGVSNPDSRGWFVASRINTSTVQAYRNAIEVLNATQAQTILPTAAIALLATRSGGLERHSPVNLALATIGANLTAAEITADYTTIQAFQTALGRQV